MSDTITIRVKDTSDGSEKWTEYSLSYEDFAFIQPVLDQCKDKRPFMETTPSDFSNPMSFITPFLMSPTMNKWRHPIIYNINEKPQDMEIGDVIKEYEKSGVLLIESDKNPTRPIN